jgi:hypothetical protein
MNMNQEGTKRLLFDIFMDGFEKNKEIEAGVNFKDIKSEDILSAFESAKEAFNKSKFGDKTN